RSDGGNQAADPGADVGLPLGGVPVCSRSENTTLPPEPRSTRLAEALVGQSSWIGDGTVGPGTRDRRPVTIPGEDHPSGRGQRGLLARTEPARGRRRAGLAPLI